MYRAMLTSGVEPPVLAGDITAAGLGLTVPGDYWHDLDPCTMAVFAWRDGEALGWFDIKEIEQDNAPYGPVQISAERQR